MYLSEATIIETLRAIAEMMSTNNEGSKVGNDAPWYIAFDYTNANWALSPLWLWGMSQVREPFKFAAYNETQINDLVESAGLSVLEHLSDPTELSLRYLPKPVDTNSVGKYGGFVVAGPSHSFMNQTNQSG